MTYVVSVPVWEGPRWGYSYPALTTFETDSDEKAIRIFRHHKWRAEKAPTSIRKASFLISGDTYWKNAILGYAGNCTIQTAIAGPTDDQLRDDTARTDDEEVAHRAYVDKILKEHGYR